MTYEEKRAQYGSDEEMARAMFEIAVSLQHDFTGMEHSLEIAQHRLRKSENKLFSLQNPNKKTNYTMEHA